MALCWSVETGGSAAAATVAGLRSGTGVIAPGTAEPEEETTLRRLSWLVIRLWRKATSLFTEALEVFETSFQDELAVHDVEDRYDGGC